MYLSGKQVATTSPDGAYTLESMKPGTYTLGVTAPRLKFDDAQVKITHSTPQLPPLVATRLVHGFTW